MARKKYSAEFKTQVVLEVLKGEKSLNQIAQDNNILPKNIERWKKEFLANAEIAMEPSKAVKEYKDKIKELEKQIEEYAKTVGQLTVERNWLEKKLKSLDLSTKRRLVQADENEELSDYRKHKLLEISRSYKYYEAKVNEKKIKIKQRIKEISEDEFMCVYGEVKVWKQLLSEGYQVSLNTVSKYRKEMGIKAILAVKPVFTTIPNSNDKKYPYKLKGVDIDRSNKVWSADITYVKTKFGTVYLAAVIDWYSKAILSWKISNIMDTDFVMDVLENALKKHPKPDIFNTDQGSQYTSYIHTKTLKENGIEISMDSKGRATDNIAIERFWRSAKVERIYLNEYNSISELREDIKNYINFYNNQRFHQSLNYKKPMEVYNEWLENNINKTKKAVKFFRKVA